MATFDSLLKQYDRITEEVSALRIRVRQAEMARDQVKRQLKALTRGAGQQVESEPETGRLELLDPPSASTKAADSDAPSEAISAAVKAVADAGKPVTVVEVAKALNITTAAAGLRLRRATASNLVRRDDRGRYMPAEEEDA